VPHDVVSHLVLSMFNPACTSPFFTSPLTHRRSLFVSTETEACFSLYLNTPIARINVRPMHRPCQPHSPLLRAFCYTSRISLALCFLATGYTRQPLLLALKPFALALPFPLHLVNNHFISLSRGHGPLWNVGLPAIQVDSHAGAS
jgi:hypothetical protein